MKTFGLFLTESSRKNLHIEHLEDEVFNGGLSGAMASISFLKGFNSLLEGSTEPTIKASVKWDGSPSIVCGPHPETGRFFLGTKSVFNTITPKINYCEADIYENHGHIPDLAKRLCEAFAELSKLGLAEVVQGDLLFVEKDLTPRSHNGQTHITFKPNTITYSIPTNTTLGESLVRAKVGVVFHTTYQGKCLKTLTSTNEAKVYTTLPSVVIFESGIHPIETLKTEQAHITAGMSRLIELFDSLDSSVLKTIANTPSIQRTIKRYINSKIVLGETTSASESYINNFYKFLESNHKKFLGYFLEHREELTNLFAFVEQVISVKHALLESVHHKNDIFVFIESVSGFKSTAMEGVVLSDKLGNIVKLVNRPEFSRSNFNNRGLV